MYALIRLRDQYTVVSDTKLGLAYSAGMQLDYDTFEMYVNGEKDTIRYSKEHTDSEFEHAASERYISLLCRDRGYKLFKQVE